MPDGVVPSINFDERRYLGKWYGIARLDHENYQYAFASGHNTSFLWLLSRTPAVSEEVKERFIAMSRSRLGFDTHELIFAQHK
ncbi:apolipoprotein D and lipocalin family protein [Nitrosomonas sp. Nm51]|uniref:lipocalin family protein n=1 Tax=Nitrosomonas sp. Nm51 TaxID=133720 RepID=UPI0008C00B74|nr:lipocalin family protein [Nitrosomonas sp. Nm51]SER59220.1 apolipoprotein D and lipocalin family protein [Nitrosomonas sp. Nm51]